MSFRNLIAPCGLALAASWLSSPVLAQSDETESVSNEIIVEGYTKKDVREYLWRSLAETDDQIARRQGPVCLGIDNIPDAVAQPVAERIKANLTEIEVEIDDPGCQVNALVVFHSDAKGFANALKKWRPLAFKSMQKPEQRRLLREDRPVYSWMFIPTEVRELVSDQSELRPFGVNADTSVLSRIPQAKPANIARSFTVIDTDKLDGMTTTQLADYLTLQIMIEFKPGEAKAAPADSILNLFYVDDPALDAPEEMSRLDREMLNQIYSPFRRQFSGGSIRAGIAIGIIDELEEEGLIEE